MAPILVTGGTGTLGAHVVALLRESGEQVRVLSRRPGLAARAGIEYVTGDLARGEGVDAAVDGVRTIVHCAGGNSGDEVQTRGLVAAASRAGARHLVYISVVGAGRAPIGYYRQKLAAESIVACSGLGWTTLRATQFHELVLTVAGALARLPVIPLPSGIRVQPIAAIEVAARLAELALDEPAGLVPDVAGPRVYGAAELLRSYLAAGHRRRPILPLWMPGRAMGAMRSGVNINPDRAVGHITWEEFLSLRMAGAPRADAA